MYLVRYSSWLTPTIQPMQWVSTHIFWSVSRKCCYHLPERPSGLQLAVAAPQVDCISPSIFQDSFIFMVVLCPRYSCFLKYFIWPWSRICVFIFVFLNPHLPFVWIVNLPTLVITLGFWKMDKHTNKVYGSPLTSGQPQWQRGIQPE